MAEITILSEVSGTVSKIEHGVGQHVDADDPIVVVELMKMELPIVATHGGTIRELFVAEGDVIEEGQRVAIIDAS